MCLKVKSRFENVNKNTLGVEIKGKKIDIEEMSLSSLKTELLEVQNELQSDEIKNPISIHINQNCNSNVIYESLEKSSDEGNVSNHLMEIEENYNTNATDSFLENNSESLYWYLKILELKTVICQKKRRQISQ